MKVREIQLRHFKRFSDQRFCFEDERGLPRDLVVLVGPNGCGKSSVLQAIAATLGAATGRLERASALQWPGFDLPRAGRAWERPTEVHLDMVLSADEVEATQRAFFSIPKAERRAQFGDTGASSSERIRLTLDGDTLGSDKSLSGVLAHRGRLFAEQAASEHRSRSAGHEHLGTVHWYTEHRSLTSISLDGLAAGVTPPPSLDLLRARLAQLQSFHSIVLGRRSLRSDERDLYADLEQRWRSVFPGRSFEGISISDRPEHVLEQPPFFLLDAERRPYELGEMSGAERAIFPLVFDFANWNIRNSVVLIDELELHLHPPLQQALLRALPLLGENNQFIVTTHSDHIADLVPPGAILHVGDR